VKTPIDAFEKQRPVQDRLNRNHGGLKRSTCPPAESVHFSSLHGAAHRPRRSRDGLSTRTSESISAAGSPPPHARRRDGDAPAAARRAIHPDSSRFASEIPPQPPRRALILVEDSNEFRALSSCTPARGCVRFASPQRDTDPLRLSRRALILCSFPSALHLVPARRAEGKPESRFPLRPPIRSVLPGQKEVSARRPGQERSHPHPHLFDGGQTTRYIKRISCPGLLTFTTTRACRSDSSGACDGLSVPSCLHGDASRSAITTVFRLNACDLPGHSQP